MVTGSQRFSLICDHDGRVEKILYDMDHILPSSFEGKMFFVIIVPEDLHKILNFFLELKTHGTAVSWEININLRAGPATFSFFGGMFGDKIGIAAADSGKEARELFDELARINSEQANIIRKVSKENVHLKTGTNDPEMFYYEELSRLNNNLVNIQRELAKKNRELDELNKMKNQFLGIASHDLRSPLGIINSYSEILLAEDTLLSKEESADLIRRISKTARFMLGLVNNLLDIANIESGKLELDLKECDLREVIIDNLEMFNLLSRPKSISLTFLDPGHQVMVMIDRPKIEQVLTNLVSNAIKYSFPQSEVFLSLQPGNDQVKVSVKDHGQGIKASEINKLFKPFQKTSTKGTAGEISTGLGLSIVKRIVEEHQGEVGVISNHGEGSVFYFYLPEVIILKKN